MRLLARPPKQDIIVVPPGNHAKQQPKVFAGSSLLTGDPRLRRLQATSTSKVYGLFSQDKALVAKIKKAAAAYGIDPMHIIGAIVGEHTYNIDTFDTLQTYYVKALEYADPKSLSFAYQRRDAAQLFARPQFAACAVDEDATTNCGTAGRRCGTRRSTARSSTASAFRPTAAPRLLPAGGYAGQTFGIGQLSPVAALMVTDVVHAKSGLPLLSIDNAPQVYQQIMNPDTVGLSTSRRNIRVVDRPLQQHRRLRHFQEPRPHRHALQSRQCRDPRPPAQGRQRRAARPRASRPQFPQENFYGWLINDERPSCASCCRGDACSTGEHYGARSLLALSRT